MADARLAPLPPLHALRAFHAAAHCGRFREAAAALGLSESAVSHQVRKLETYLAVQLFERAGNSVSLTAAGQLYFDQIDPAFTRIRSATDALARPTSRVSLTLPSCIATLWLIPRLGGLEAEHPEVSVQLVTTTRVCDLRREQIDLGIRYGEGTWNGLQAQHLFDEEAFPVCRPGFLTEGEGLDTQTALRSARIIVNAGHPQEWAEWAAAHGLEPPLLNGAIMLDSSEQILEAAAQGLGLAIGREPMLSGYLAEGRLAAPFGGHDKSGCAYYLVYPDDVELSVSARRVARWLTGLAEGRQGAEPLRSADRHATDQLS